MIYAGHVLLIDDQERDGTVIFRWMLVKSFVRMGCEFICSELCPVVCISVSAVEPSGSVTASLRGFENRMLGNILA
jgi:hypothetical protein